MINITCSKLYYFALQMRHKMVVMGIHIQNTKDGVMCQQIQAGGWGSAGEVGAERECRGSAGELGAEGEGKGSAGKLGEEGEVGG